MIDFILTIVLLFISIMALSVGIYSLKKYKKDSGISEIGFWEKLLVVFGHAVLSVVIIPVAIANWVVNTAINFKEE